MVEHKVSYAINQEASLMIINLLILGGGTLYASFKSYQIYHLSNQSPDTLVTETTPTKSSKHKRVKARTRKRTLTTHSNLPQDDKNCNKTLLREQEATHYLKVSSVAMGTSMVSALAGIPQLNLITTVPIILYNFFPVFKSAYRSVAEEHRMRASIIDSIAIISILGVGYYVVASAASVIYYYGERLSAKTEYQSQQQIINIFGQQPRHVWIVKDGVEIEIPVGHLEKGNLIVVGTGEMIPVDGMVMEGAALVDQHILTGEAQPIEKRAGESVFAATVILGGKIYIQVEKYGPETIAAQIGKILNKTADYRSKLEARAIQVADQMVTPTLVVSGLALYQLGIIPAVAAMNCNFSDVVRIAYPLGMLNYLKLASEQGILVKDGRSLELLAHIDTMVFDKTGTLTLAQPHVGAIHRFGESSEEELLRLAATAEHKQTHPIAKAILTAAQERGLELSSTQEARYEMGYGLKIITTEGQTVLLGSQRFLEMQGLTMSSEIQTLQSHCNEQGNSLIYISIGNSSESLTIAGAIELHATIRPEAKQVIADLKQRGLSIYIISGDHSTPTQKLAEELGIPNYFADTLPEDKAKLIEQLQKTGKKVAFVGDGINDAIALKTANVSISLRGASTIATDTAGIVLMDQSLHQLCSIYDLAQNLAQNMKTSLSTVMVPGIIGVGGVWFLHLGIYSTVLLYLFSITAGITNAMLPIMNQRKNDDDKEV